MPVYTCVGYRVFESRKNQLYQVGYFLGELSGDGCEGQEAFQAFIDPSFKLVPGMVYQISWYDQRSRRVGAIQEA